MRIRNTLVICNTCPFINAYANIHVYSYIPTCASWAHTVRVYYAMVFFKIMHSLRHVIKQQAHSKS